MKDHDNNQYTRNISYLKNIYATTLPIMVKPDITVEYICGHNNEMPFSDYCNVRMSCF